MRPTTPPHGESAPRTWGNAALRLDPGFESELRHLLHDRDVGCPRCRYNLSGVTGDRCPECGVRLGEFLRLADVSPWRVPAARRAETIRVILRWLGIAALGVAVGCGAQVLVWLLR